MAGIEVAGLVLAAFPLVVRGLQHFTEGVNTVKSWSWKSYQRELINYTRTIRTEGTYCLDTLEGLLSGIIKSDDEYDALKKDPGGALWQKPEYQGQLKRRLDHNYDNYMDTMKIMLRTLEIVRGKLGVDDSGKILWDGHDSLKGQVKRLKLALSKSVYDKLLAQIREANGGLRECTHHSISLEPIRSKRRAQRSSVDFTLIRQNAKSLFNVFINGRSWRCTCRQDHVASLRLEPRPWDQNRDESRATRPSSLKFRVMLSKQRDDDENGVSCMWQEIEVEPAESPARPLAEIHGMTSLSVSPSLDSAAQTRTAGDLSNFTSNSIQPSVAINDLSSEMSPIVDICTTIHGVKNTKQELGFLTDELVGQHRHKIYFVEEKIRPGMDLKSLKHLLEAQRQQGQLRSLSRRLSLYIAVTLASSVLQLDGMSWLKRYWRSDDIYFLPIESGERTKFEMDYAHPYVSWRVSSEDMSTNRTTNAKFAPIANRVPSEILFVLGITLTELCFGRSISDMRIEDDYEPTKIMTSFTTASRLIGRVYDESGERYGDVVRKCLKCPPDVRDASLDKKEFQEAVFDTIVTPLKEDFENFNGNPWIR